MNFIVTGASNGIGYEGVKLLSTHKGHNIVAISRNKEELIKLTDECERINGYKNVFPISFDLTEIDRKQTILKSQILACFKKIDVLINNAGTLINKPFHHISQNEINLIFDTNFIAPSRLMQLFIAELAGGHIVNISSMGGYQGSSKYPGLSFYSASKSALCCLTECLAEEYKDKNISFNCLALGAVQTEMLNNAFPGYKAPLGATEMAQYIVDFAIEGKKYFNGKIIPVALSNP